MRITLIHPSRQRPEKSFRTISDWINKAGTDVHEVIISLDRDDPRLNDYYKAYHQDDKIIILEQRNRSAIDAVNNAATIATGEVFIVVSDDFECPQNWAVLLSKILKGKRDFVLKVYDGIQNYIATLPILDTVYYQRFGYIYNPIYLHLFSDMELTHVADLTRRLIIRNDITFRHAHHSVTKHGIDEVTRRAEATQTEGCRIYLKRCREKFGLSQTTDIRRLSPEGATHLQWLEKHGI